MYSHIREISQNNKPKGTILSQETVEETPKHEVAQFIYHDSKPRLFPKLKLLVGILSLIAFVLGVYLVWLSVRPVKNSSESSQTFKYKCPTSEYVDCMPGPGASKPQCATVFLNWAKQNCPGFKGAAY